jgi:hypothetical protein
MPTASGLSSSSGSHKSLPWTRCGPKWDPPSRRFCTIEGVPHVPFRAQASLASSKDAGWASPAHHNVPGRPQGLGVARDVTAPRIGARSGCLEGSILRARGQDGTQVPLGVDCRCSSALSQLEGHEASQYVLRHLALVWSNGVVSTSGYVCPITGLRWMMDYPEHGDHQWQMRIRVVTDREWDADMPHDLGFPPDFVRKCGRWRVMTDLPSRGITTWTAPFTGGFECVIPNGTVLTVEHDPVMGAKAVYCRPENYKDFESAFVPAEEREAENYSGYALSISLTDFGEALRQV